MKRRTANWFKSVGKVTAALLVNHWAHVAYVSDFLDSVLVFVLAILVALPLTGWRLGGPLEDVKYDPIEGDGAAAVRLDAVGTDLVAVLDVLRRSAHLDFRQGVTACRRTPSIIGVNLSAEAAETLAAQLRKAGAEISVLDSDI